jgi:hypothetical protein
MMSRIMSIDCRVVVEIGVVLLDVNVAVPPVDGAGGEAHHVPLPHPPHHLALRPGKHNAHHSAPCSSSTAPE